MTDPGHDPAARPSGAQAVERALALLACFEEADELRLVDLAQRTGLQPPTAYRIVRALCRNGFLAQDPGSERYRLGFALAVLGQRAAGALGLDAARAVLDDLAASTGESAALGLPAGPAHLRVALVASSSQRLRFDHVAGDTVRLHASAMGKAFLAFAPGDPRALIEALGPLESYTTHTIVTPEGLTAELAAIRRRGFARNDAERYDGVVGVAAPVLDGAGQARAAVGLQGPASRLGRRRLDALAGEVRAAADRCAGVLPLPLL